MHLYLLLALVFWVSESHSAPMKADTVTLQKNHTALCAEIQEELSADNKTYEVSLGLHQTRDTFVVLCVSEQFLLLAG